ncbi:centromere protein T isoform X2 [Melopsittacus undulatus]|uniref:Centromere protein T n=1 Tax=Melopsittacus undulatus TaxID=13146 RepID=A0A8C6IP13_MELUD|nr:centromere protein T isoform X2 [Melopsittacus undulatus]
MSASRSSSRLSSTGAAAGLARRSSSRRSTSGAAAKLMDGARERIQEETRSNRKKNLMRQGPLLCDVTSDTPRTLIKKIIHIFPPASPVVPDVSKHEEPAVAAEEAQAELPAEGFSNMEEMQLPELVPEERAVFTCHMNKETKQLKISEFERAVNQQLAQNQVPSLLDSTVAGMSLGYLVQPDTVERRHLCRRPKNRKPVDIKAFEDKVEQDMLRRKAQSYPVDSEMSPASQTTRLTSVGTGERRMQGYSQDLVLDHEHVYSTTPVSSKSPENPPENKQDHSQWTNAMDQLSVSEEAVVGKAAPSEEEGIAEGGVEYQDSPEAERDIAQGIGAGSLSKHSNPTFSEKSGMEPLKDAVEQADELEDQFILVELGGLEEEPIENEAEDAENENDFMKTPPFIHAAACKPPTPSLAKPAAPEPPLQPQQAEPVLKCSQKKTLEPKMPSSLVKRVFKDYVKMPVATESFGIVEKCTKKYFKRLWSDLAAFANHAGRKTVEASDVEVLMRRQRLVTDEIPLHVLIERHLPMDYRKLLIPVAMSGNKVIPEIKHKGSCRVRKDA